MSFERRIVLVLYDSIDAVLNRFIDVFEALREKGRMDMASKSREEEILTTLALPRRPDPIKNNTGVLVSLAMSFRPGAKAPELFALPKEKRFRNRLDRPKNRFDRNDVQRGRQYAMRARTGRRRP